MLGSLAWLDTASAPGPLPAPESEPESLEFTGCRPVRISRDTIADYEGRIEYWDAHTEVAMVCEPVSIYHEHPPQRLAGLLKTISHVRGSPIETFGASDLLVRDAQGAHLRIMQADQTVYLRPRATRPWGPAIEVGSDVLPDVVLEVDVFPKLGRKPVSEITTADVLGVIVPIWHTKTATARRVKGPHLVDHEMGHRAEPHREQPGQRRRGGGAATGHYPETASSGPTT